jgi:hypothetical protein
LQSGIIKEAERIADGHQRVVDRVSAVELNLAVYQQSMKTLEASNAERNQELMAKLNQVNRETSKWASFVQGSETRIRNEFVSAKVCDERHKGA